MKILNSVLALLLVFGALPAAFASDEVLTPYAEPAASTSEETDEMSDPSIFLDEEGEPAADEARTEAY